jgi:hypothetical protein
MSETIAMKPSHAAEAVETKTCPKCHGTMSEGCVIDHTNSGTLPAEWCEGQATISWFSGHKFSGKRRRIQGFCCDNCGLMELYALKFGQRLK